MNDHTRPDPTPEEQAEAERAIREFMAAQQAVPESERTVITSEKYDGPIGEPVRPADDTPAQSGPQ